MPAKSSVELALRAGAAASAIYSAYRGGSRTQTITMPRNNLPVLTEAGEYTRKNRNSGRYKKRTLRRLYKIVNTAQQPQWYRFSGKNRFNSGGGYYGLPNHLNTTAPGIEYLPMYFFELQTCINFNGAIQNPFPFWAVQRTNSASQSYQLVQNNGQTDTGSSFGQWILEDTPGQTSYPGRAATHKYSDIRMMIYGATQTPIKYDICIVSFPDDEYNPFNGVYNPTTSSTFSVAGLSAILLDNLLAPYASNPINIQEPKLRDKIKYYFRENFIIQPGSTTDGDAGVPHFRELRIFKKWDQIVRFDWGPTDRVDPQVPAGFQQNLTAINCSPNFPYRKYLMIRATSAYTSSGVAPLIDTTKNGTFDLLVRNKWDVPFG